MLCGRSSSEELIKRLEPPTTLFCLELNYFKLVLESNPKEAKVNKIVEFVIDKRILCLLGAGLLASRNNGEQSDYKQRAQCAAMLRLLKGKRLSLSLLLGNSVRDVSSALSQLRPPKVANTALLKQIRRQFHTEAPTKQPQ